ncbi:MAG: hypothetical protein AAGF99_12510 [Bacteroidota bacterium]
MLEVQRSQSACAATLYSMGVYFSRSLFGKERRESVFDTSHVEITTDCDQLFAQLEALNVSSLPDRRHTRFDPYAGHHCPYLVYRLEVSLNENEHDVQFWSLGPGQTQDGDMQVYKSIESLLYEAAPVLYGRLRISPFSACFYQDAE